MRDKLKVQELMDVHLDQRGEELRLLQSQSQADGAQLAALSLQVWELISLVEARAKVHPTLTVIQVLSALTRQGLTSCWIAHHGVNKHFRRRLDMLILHTMRLRPMSSPVS